MHKGCLPVKDDVLHADPYPWNCVCEQKLNDESILRSQLDMKTPHHSVSGRSYMVSTPDSSNIAVFEVRSVMTRSINHNFDAHAFGCFWLCGFVYILGGLGLVKEMPRWSSIRRQQQHWVGLCQGKWMCGHVTHYLNNCLSIVASKNLYLYTVIWIWM